MCGISGYLLTRNPHSSSAVIHRMTRALAHRGPDDEGLTLIAEDDVLDLRTDATSKGARECWSPSDATTFSHRAAFGHRRFSIVDPSRRGHQPFWSSDQRVCVAFNGEIYNHVELRQELATLGWSFRSSCDTEVLVSAYQEWGTDCFTRFNGFWAVSLYDARRRSILLARDRIGKAALYMTRTKDGIFWSSEINSLRSGIGASEFSVNDSVVCNYVLHGRRDVFGETFYKEIETFPSASYAWLSPDGRIKETRYWQLPERRLSERDITPSEAGAQLRRLLADAIALRMRADAPVALELSGGLDSSAISALAVSPRKTTATYTATFGAFPEIDEGPYADAVLRRFGENLRPTMVDTPGHNFVSQADSFLHLMGEPFHSPNLFSYQELWRAMAASGVRVSIAGGGADELFAGYRYEYHGPYLRMLL
ncbi:MAG: asparagine synthase (glutamine-hydrolyzing), partial [Actinomycetota bacterium]|nr:asparagine synthase (glutamine-hydrolyzing) [Actinomycetota bacterium]